MIALWILGSVVALVALAAGVEAYVRRNRAPRRLLDTRPEMPTAKSNLGFGYDKEWRPTPIKDPADALQPGQRNGTQPTKLS